MKKNNKYYVINCSTCKSDIKVSPEVYRSKEKIKCDTCLGKTLNKFKLS